MGVETLVGLGIGNGLLVELSATLTDPRDTTPNRTVANDYLPYRSRLVVSPSVGYETGVLAPVGIDLAKAGVVYYYQSSRYADSAGLVVIGSQNSLDLTCEFDVGTHVVVAARASNILDSKAYDMIGYPLAGRAVYLSGELKW
jgi:iron complex outermembrane receptor protein